MKSLHDLLLTNHAAENDEGLMALYHAVAWHPEIDSFLFDAHLQALPSLHATQLLAPHPTTTSNMQFAVILRDTHQYITDELKANLRRKHIPDALMEVAWKDAVIAAELARAVTERPLKRHRY